eukprot:208928-Amphidinium_carterae.1
MGWNGAASNMKSLDVALVSYSIVNHGPSKSHVGVLSTSGKYEPEDITQSLSATSPAASIPNFTIHRKLIQNCAPEVSGLVGRLICFTLTSLVCGASLLLRFTCQRAEIHMSDREQHHTQHSKGCSSDNRPRQKDVQHDPKAQTKVPRINTLAEHPTDSALMLYTVKASNLPKSSLVANERLLKSLKYFDLACKGKSNPVAGVGWSARDTMSSGWDSGVSPWRLSHCLHLFDIRSSTGARNTICE